jgi:hypothetical protein
MGKCISRRYPMGFCRLDNSNLLSTGFRLESESHSSFSVTSLCDRDEDGTGRVS